VSDSLPPHLLRVPGSVPGSAPRGRQAAPAPELVSVSGQQSAPPSLLAAPGRPGTYSPAVTSTERPRNVTELQARVQPATPEPWPVNAYVLVGTTGKRAHWTGTGWKGGASPGYPSGALVAVRSATEQTTGAVAT
jgi:hypothetical protein